LLIKPQRWERVVFAAEYQLQRVTIAILNYHSLCCLMNTKGKSYLSTLTLVHHDRFVTLFDQLYSPKGRHNSFIAICPADDKCIMSPLLLPHSSL